MTATLGRDEIKSRIASLTKQTDEIASSFKVEDGGEFVVSAEQKSAFVSASTEIKSLTDILRALDSTDESKSYLNTPRGVPIGGSDAADAARGMERKSLADHLLTSDSFQSMNRDKPFVRVDVEGMNVREQKAIYGGSAAGVAGGNVTIPGLGSAQNIGITESRLRSRHVRDLFPNARTTASVLYGIRETGFVNNAAVVKVRNAGNTDFELKPESDLTLAPQMYPVARVAHWLRAHQDILSDEPRLRDFINRRMVDGLMLAEDREILFGAGGGEAITGIMNTAGVQTYTGLASDKFTAQIRRAATRAMLAEYEPTGIVLHPLDWESLELETDANGAYRVAISVAVGGEKRIWNLDIVTTTAMTQGRFLVGSFGLGSQVYDREQAAVLISTEDSDNFRRNAVTIRAEERLAVVVDRPESHVAGTLTVPV